jgi:pimeloyl-ACP methyl ester carboxylesterase
MDTALLQRQPVEVDGVVLDTVVLGEGPVTVVLVNGLGSPLEEWSLVAPAIAERSRVLCYDRRPAPSRGRIPMHDAVVSVQDLHGLLAALDISGPLVLVGHSWGGAVIRHYAASYPDEVKGMVFVDASHEKIKGMMPNRFSGVLYTTSSTMLRIGPLRRRLLRSLGFEHLPPTEQAFVGDLGWVAAGRTSRAEYAGIGTSLQQLLDLAPALPPVPTRVLLAGGRPGLVSKLAVKQIASIRAVWENAVAGRDDIVLSSVTGAGHYISLDRPQAVIDAIDEVVDLVALQQAR